MAAAVDQIDSLIADGQLVPGQRLVEADLSEQLNIGRGPIREALRILAGDGVVELMPNRGARVRSFSGREISEMLRALVGLLFVGVEEFAASAEYEVGLRKLESIVREYPSKIAANDGYGLLDAMSRYQRVVFETSHNGYLMELHRRVHFHHYNRQMLAMLGFDQLKQIAPVYERVTDALRGKNSALASAVLKVAVAEMVRTIEGPPKPG